MTSQNRRDFFKTLGVMRATVLSLPTYITKKEEKFKLSENRMGMMVDKTLNMDRCHCMVVLLFLIPAFSATESIQIGIVYYLILQLIKSQVIYGGIKWLY